jgi:hypothetical protein
MNSGHRYLPKRPRPPTTAHNDDLRDFTSEAKRAFDREVRGFAEELKAKVRAGTAAEAVLLVDVTAAAKVLRSEDTKERSNVVSGWLRAVGFFLAGIAAAQFVRLGGGQLTMGGVALLIGEMVLAASCLTGSAFLDFATGRARKEH